MRVTGLAQEFSNCSAEQNKLPNNKSRDSLLPGLLMGPRSNEELMGLHLAAVAIELVLNLRDFAPRGSCL